MDEKLEKELILDTVEDLIADFLYYDRKEDEDLSRGKIEQAINKGVVTVDEIVETFRLQLMADMLL